MKSISMIPAATVCLSLLLIACKPGPITPTYQPNGNRNQRLMTLAAEEAALIEDADLRLTRQLNIAATQIQAGWNQDAAVTLAASRATLQSDAAQKLAANIRISGWVSISELSRRISDAAAAGFACDRAVEEVRAIPHVPDRCLYVMSLANELLYLRGPNDAAGFLAEGGPWAKQIDNQNQRRNALATFAAAIFNLDQFEQGQKVLRNDPDAAWRSETISNMVQYATHSKWVGTSVTMDAPAAAATLAPAAKNYQYGQSLRFDDVYRGQQRANVRQQDK